MSIMQSLHEIDLISLKGTEFFVAIALVCLLLFWVIPFEIIAKRKFQNQLEESEERFRTITESANDITIIYRRNYGFVYVSPSVTHVLGFTMNEFYGKTPEQILHPNDLEPFLITAKSLRDTENVTVNVKDFRVRNKQGNWVYFEGRITNMPKVRGVEGLVINCRDIQKRKEAQALLNHRLDMDMMVSKISAEFIHTETNNVCTKIEKTLATLGNFEHLDHVYFFQLNEAKNTFENVFEWCAKDKPSISKDLEPICFENYPWMFEQLEMLESVHIPDVFKLSKKARQEKEIFKQAGLRSALFVPVTKDRRLNGFLMLDSLVNKHQWSKHDISLLNVIAEIISNAIQRSHTEDNLVTLSSAVDQSLSAITILTPEGVVKYVNKKFEDTTGYQANEIVGESIIKCNHVFGLSEKYKDISKLLKNNQEWRGEVLNKTKEGEDLWQSIVVSPIKGNNGKIKYILLVCEDITLKKEYENKLIYQANYDDLTGIPNRMLAHDRLSEAITRAQLNRESVAAIIVGLDTFKKVNETLGHNVGDQLLIQASLRLQNYVPELGTLARFGGDEFLIILPVEHDDYAEIVASRILESFAEPFNLQEHEVTVTASMGISIYPNDGDDTNVILRNAGNAMHRAKDEGRNNFQFFAEEMHSDALKRVQMEGLLRRALELEELELYYQPIVETKPQKVVGAEALIRWHSKQLGFVSPADFIPLAEDIGFIVPLGEWILKTACTQAAKWAKQKGMPNYVSVNVSVRQFKGEDFAEVVRHTLEGTGLDAHHLKIEVTESLLVDEELGGVVDEALTELKKMGVKISLDDFGTGYSSLSYLKKYDFDTLKIDRSFVRDVPEDKEDKALVEAIMAMAHSLELEVVAEGVETEEQLAYLGSLGCDSIQGFYFSKPLPSKDFNNLIENWPFKAGF